MPNKPINIMAASMDVNLQMDQYHAHLPHGSNSTLSSHTSSGHLSHQNPGAMLSGQFNISQNHGSHFTHNAQMEQPQPPPPPPPQQQSGGHPIHTGQNAYVNPSNSVQQLQHQLLLQQQAQLRSAHHFNQQAVENSNDLASKQMHPQMPAQHLHHAMNNNSLPPSGNMQYSTLPPPMNQSIPQTLQSPMALAKDPFAGSGAYNQPINSSAIREQDMLAHVAAVNQHPPQHYPYLGVPGGAPTYPQAQPQNMHSAAGMLDTTHTRGLASHSNASTVMQHMNSVSLDMNDQLVTPAVGAPVGGNSIPSHLPAPTYVPPAKKRRGRPAAHPTTDPGGGGTGALGAGTAGGATNTDEEEPTLYGAVRSGRVAPQTVVDDWIEQYKTSREPAMLELIQFFISCSGCKGKVTPDMYSQWSHADIIRRMTEEFDEDSGEYPLIQGSPAWRRFRNNFIEFIQVLIRQCQYSIIYDQCMIDQIISLLTGLTDSQVRAFRHTSTLASMKMMTALVDVALNVSINRDNTQRQYEAERSKMVNRRASDRLEALMQRRQELEENMEEVKNMLIFLFKGVFVHRYRDSQPEIRSICIQEIGVWMRRYPAMFLDDSYLKYVGWTLYDRVGDVRVQCLRALQPLYEDPALINSMELFTSRFKSRLVDMTLDKETDVAVQAVKLVSCILKHNDSILEDKDCENIYELVYCTHRPLAQAAGEFLTLKLFDVDSHAPPTKTKKGKRRSENTPLIRDLVQFFIESELHEHAAYLVDSIWDLSPMLRDWEAMLDLLLEEPGRGEEPMDANQETSLIEIMICCVRQAATGESPVGRQTGTHHSHSNALNAGPLGSDPTGPRGGRGAFGGGGGGGPAPSAREARAIAEERVRLTEAMITALPALLTKYGESPERAANLLTIPRYMDIELYTTGRHERHLDLLLQAVQDIVDRHTDPTTLFACSRLYEALCFDELSVAAKCQTVRGTLLDRLTEVYRNAFLNYFNDQGEAPDQEDEFHLFTALKRIYAFYTCHDLSGLDLWDSLIRVAQAGNEANGEIVGQAIACCSSAVLWTVARLSEADADKAEITYARRMVTVLMDLSVGYLDHSSKRLSHQSYLTVCDLLVVLSRHLAVRVPSLKSLAYPSDRELELKLTTYLERRVFVDDEELEDDDENAKFEALHERRTQLAAFCKLVIYNFVPIRAAAPLYKYYIRSFNDFGDIMKSTLAKSREINRVHTARMIAHCLQLCYAEIESNIAGRVERGSDGVQSVRELSRRLNLSFGLDLVKIREAMVAFHSEGIQFCVASAAAAAVASGQPAGVPPNLLFLEIVTEFSNKLLRQDKKGLYEYVGRVFPNPIGEEWASLHVYRSSLDPDLAEAALASGLLDSVANAAGGGMHPPGSSALPTTGRGGGRGRGKRHARDTDLSLPGSDAGLMPHATSTTVKRRRGGSTRGAHNTTRHAVAEAPVPSASTLQATFSTPGPHAAESYNSSHPIGATLSSSVNAVQQPAQQ